MISDTSALFEIIVSYLFNLKYNMKASDEIIADYYLCEFLAISMRSGALCRDFHRYILNAKFSDITLNPLSFKKGPSVDDRRQKAEVCVGGDASYLRYWMPPIAEAYFLRLMLFLHRRRKKLEFRDDYIFPVSWRTSENILGLSNKFLKWTQHIKAINGISCPDMSLNTFRKHALLRLAMKLPGFVIAALSGEIKCDSLDLKHLSMLDPDINSHLMIEIPGGTKSHQKRQKRFSQGRVIGKKTPWLRGKKFC